MLIQSHATEAMQQTWDGRRLGWTAPQPKRSARRPLVLARAVRVAVAALLTLCAAGMNALRECGSSGADQCDPEGNHAHNLPHDHLHL